jgi:hypothetical protein
MSSAKSHQLQLPRALAVPESPSCGDLRPRPGPWGSDSASVTSSYRPGAAQQPARHDACYP